MLVVALRDYSDARVSSAALLAWQAILERPEVAPHVAAFRDDPNPRARHLLVSALAAAGVVSPRERQRICDSILRRASSIPR